MDWCRHYSDSATPLHPRTLRSRVLEMVGVYPGKHGSAALFLVTPTLSARIKGHLEDPETCVVLANNPRFSALYGSKRRVRITIPATSEGSSHSTPVASTSTTNDPSPPQMPSFSQTQEYQPLSYSNHSSNYNTGSSSFHLAQYAPHTSTSDSLQSESVVPSSMNLNNYNQIFNGNLR